MKFRVLAAFVSLAAWPSPAQQDGAGINSGPVQDEYAVYDLQAPETASFKTVYEVAFTTAGATVFHDGIGAGLTTAPAAGDGVVDLMSGLPLKYTVSATAVDVQLARPVPADGGQARLRISKTYKDAKNYRREGDVLVFDRPVPIRHAAIILPAGYQLTECNVPSQVLADPDGRIRVSFMYQAPGAPARSCSRRSRARSPATPRSRGR